MRFQRIRYRRSVMLRVVGGVVIRQRLRHALCIRQRARCLMLLRILHGGGKQRCDQRHNGDDINAHPSCRSADDCARMRRNGRITVLLLKIPAVKGHAVVNAQCNAPDAHAQGQQQDRGDPHEKRLRRLCGPAAVAGQLHTQLSKKGKAHAQHGQQRQPIGQICACKPFVTAAVKLMERPQKECRRIETASSARSDVCKFPCVIGRNDPAQPGAGLEHAVDTALRFLRGIPLYRRAVCALRRICGLHRPRLLLRRLHAPTAVWAVFVPVLQPLSAISAFHFYASRAPGRGALCSQISCF